MSPRGAIAAALILGCSSPRAPAPESPAPKVVVPVASVPATPPPPAAEQPAREPGEIRECAPLAPAPGAKPVAEVNVGVDVELVETRGPQARILVDRRDVMVSGWVEETDADKAEFRTIDLPESPWLLMEKNARILVAAAELKACRQDSPGF